MNCLRFLMVLFTLLCTCTSSYSSDCQTFPNSQTPQFSFQLTNNFTLEKTREIDKDTYPFIQLAQNTQEFDDPFGEEFDEELEGSVEEIDTINDPLQGFNRAMFTFNDKLYYWLLKPVSRGYGFVLPKRVRISVRNFFVNLDMPVRALNCLVQGRTKGFGIELARFVVNTTVGIAGLFNPASSFCKLEPQEADFDQTLGVYGMKDVFYIHWPIFGASSVRGTLGLIGDIFTSPIIYVVDLDFYIMVLVRAYELVNETSLTIGDYEGLTEPALDPYIAVRNFFYQNRQGMIGRTRIKSASQLPEG